MALKKNFTYGELWQSEARKSDGRRHGREEVKPYKITTNTAFLNFLNDYGYRVFLDYDHKSYAYTDIKSKEIVLNGNYSDEVLDSLLKHELGHLMLFDVNQFTTVRPNTMRSVITRELYTPKRVLAHGFAQLFYTENIIQDIIIETVSNNNCVCSNMLAHDSMNAGVKHLDSLESVALIAKEVCDSRLQEAVEWEVPPSVTPEVLKEALEGMLGNLKGDTEEIRKAIEKTEVEDFQKPLENARKIQKERIRSKLDKINGIEEVKGKLTPALEKAKEVLEKALEEIDDSVAGDALKAQENKERALKALNNKLEKNKDLEELLGEAVEEAREAAKRDRKGAGEGQGDSSPDATTSGHQDSFEGEVDREISPNLTDHLHNDEIIGGNSHTFDCGLPTPATFSRNDPLHQRGNFLTHIDSSRKVRKITINDDTQDTQALGRTKTPESESTYFKPSKREFSETDMLRGKRKLRKSGVNVIIGLDVSGSMTSEWGALFTQTSSFVTDLQKLLEIDNIYYFTYHSHLKAWSKDISKLSLVAGGGNAFGHVYQEVMQTLPIAQRNEIILVTDCGDNLGFDLSSVCEISRNGEEVLNHISVIDTEGSGFYALADFDGKSWSLHNMHDSNLKQALEENITRLIEQ